MLNCRAPFAVVCVMAVAAVACGDGGSPPDPGDTCPETVVAAPASMDMDPGGVRAVTTTVTDCNGVVANPILAFSSLDPAVATVAAGAIIAEGPGAGRVVVSSGTGKDTVTVNVFSPSHPVGSALTTYNLPSNAFGVAVSGAGVVYVTELLQAAVRHDTIPLTGPLSRTFTVGDTPTDVAFVPRMNKAFVTNQGGANVGVIDPATHAQVTTVPLGGSTFRVLPAPGNLTYVTVANGRVYVLNSTSNAVADSIAVELQPNGLILSPTGGTLYLSHTSGTGLITVINTATRTVTDTFSIGGFTQDLAIAPDGQTLYVANEGLGVVSVNLATRTATDTIQVPAFGMRLTPDGTRLYVAGGATVTVIDRVTFTAFPGINVGGNARRIAFARGGRMAFVANEGGYVSVIQ